MGNELGIQYVELYLKGPDMGSFEEKAALIDVLNRAGAVTPNMLVPLVEEVLGKVIEEFDGEFGDTPIEVAKILSQRGVNTEGGESGFAKSSGDKIVDALTMLEDVIDSLECE